MKTLKPIYKGLYYFVYILLGWLVRLLFPLRIIGRENLEKGKGFVLTPNHTKAIDPLYIVLARGLSRRMLIMAKEELFAINAFINFCWRVFGVVAVDRGAGNRDLIEQMAAEVRKGTGLFIFPEGTRSKDGNLGKLKSGAFVVAMETGADMIPCIIKYNKGKCAVFNRIGVAFGKPVTMEELGLTGEYSVKKVRYAKEKYTEIMHKLIEETQDKL